MLTFLPDSLQNPFFLTEILLPLLFIVLDLVTGIGSSLKHNIFNGKLVADFLNGNVLRYLIAIITVWLTYSASGSAAATLTVSTLGLGALGVSIVSSIYQNCRELLSPAEMAVVDLAGVTLGYPDPATAKASLPLPTAPVTPTPTPTPPAALTTPTALGAFVDQRPMIAVPPSSAVPGGPTTY